jgi:peptidoglycan/xylan/chitin deacetylase (PgdA/CDA1 family)
VTAETPDAGAPRASSGWRRFAGILTGGGTPGRQEPGERRPGTPVGPRVGVLLIAVLLGGPWLMSGDLPSDTGPVAQPGPPSSAPVVVVRHTPDGPTMGGIPPRDTGDSVGPASPSANPAAGGTQTAAPEAIAGPGESPGAGSSPTPGAAASPTSGSSSPTPTAFAGLRVPILTYHVVAPWPTASAYSTLDLDVLPERMDAQLAALKGAGWRTISTDALADAIEHGRRLPPRTFVITIDDGHDDGFDYAYPIISRYGFRATYYVVTGRLGTPTYLDWAELQLLQDTGMEIGNHTIDHVELPLLTPAEILREVAGAQAAFEEHLDRAPTTFAYPFGRFDNTTIAAVQATGLRLAFTTRAGQLQTWSGRFTLPRVHVGGAMTPGQLLLVVNQFL